MSFVSLIRELCISSKGIDPFEQANWQKKTIVHGDYFMVYKYYKPTYNWGAPSCT